MTINQSREAETLTMAVSGRIDTVTAPELETAVRSSLDGVSVLIFDFAGVEYISSAGLRVMLMAQKQMNRQGCMKVIHVNEGIMEIFDVTGFSDILTIE